MPPLGAEKKLERLKKNLRNYLSKSNPGALGPHNKRDKGKQMKMNLLDFMLGMMVAIGLGIIVIFVTGDINYINMFALVMSGAFLGFPFGYYIDQVFNVETNDLGPNRDLVNLQDKDE